MPLKLRVIYQDNGGCSHYNETYKGGIQVDIDFKPKEILVVLGHNIRTSRERKGYNLSDLAQEIGYDRNCLSDAEYGEQNLEYKTVLNLSRTLNVPFPALFSRNYQNPSADNDGVLSGEFIEDDYLLVFVENYQRGMRSQQINQIEVYAAADVRPETISRILNKKILNPTIKTLYAMAYTSGIDMYNLFLRKTT